jgi:hypothetical protein
MEVSRNRSRSMTLLYSSAVRPVPAASGGMVTQLWTAQLGGDRLLAKPSQVVR